VVKVGRASSTEDAVDQAVRALHSAATAAKPVYQQADNLADLFSRSPFRGLNIEFERPRSGP